MKIIVDTNIVFSAILNSQGKIGQLIINGSNFFAFYTVRLLKDEIWEHKDKILKISGLSSQQLTKSYETITKRITFVDENIISDKELLDAVDLVADIDENDALFVALTNHIKGKLWTGAKPFVPICGPFFIFLSSFFIFNLSTPPTSQTKPTRQSWLKPSVSTTT